MTGVLFVQMPFAGIERPSLAIGLFTRALRDAGVLIETRYANLDFAAHVGLPSYVLVRLAAPASLLGEWLFAKSAFRERAPTPVVEGNVGAAFDAERAFITHVMQVDGCTSIEQFLGLLSDRASSFVDRIAAEIVERSPKVVACTSMFEQHVASLALMRRVRELDPTIITVIGGANCAGAMGWATHRCFPWIDFTATGEFDMHAVRVLGGLAREGRASEVWGADIPGLLAPRHRTLPRPDVVPPVPILRDMEQAAVPDYDDFFEQLYCSPLSTYVCPSIPLETSRGCWWGAKQHCTFCGLNAEGMAYRRKSPERAIREIRQLTSAYGLKRFAAADNIIDLSYFGSVLPELARDGQSYSFFYETKANLRRDQVAALAEAGCRFIQPGIESLHDETLKIMRKGTTACQNIQLLRYCLEFGVVPAWSILCGFPGSQADWVSRVAEGMPLLFHLPPPNGTVPIRFDRFSPYHSQASDHGLELEPLPAYRGVYPLESDDLEDLAYFFRQRGGTAAAVTEHAAQAGKVTARWRESFWSDRRAILQVVEDDGSSLVIEDTRPVDTARVHRIGGLDAQVLRALDEASTAAGVGRRRRDQGHGSYEEREIQGALGRLERRGLLWRSSTQVIALPTAVPLRPIDGDADAAVGKVDLARYLKDQGAFLRRLAARAGVRSRIGEAQQVGVP